jgi:outer membrane protein TolC
VWKAQKKALLPRISLTAVGGTSSPALTELVDPRTVAWNLAMGLVQPIFTGAELNLPARYSAHFKPGRELGQRVASLRTTHRIK